MEAEQRRKYYDRLKTLRRKQEEFELASSSARAAVDILEKQIDDLKEQMAVELAHE